MNKNLLKYAGKKLIKLALLLFAVSIITFGLVVASPMDPVKTNVGQAALGAMSDEQKAKVEDYWGVNTPPVERYTNWAKDFVKGDMGTSLIYRQPVKEVIKDKLKNSLPLMTMAWVFSGVIGFAMGCLAAMNRGKWQDKLVRGYSVAVSSTPAFWLALLLLIIFGVKLHWFPVGFSVPIGMEIGKVTLADRFYHGILPAIALSITGVAPMALHTREKMIDIAESDYFTFARSRGLKSRQLFWQHGFRNALIPAITLQFASIGEIIGGSVLVEQVFSYPGIGQAAVRAGLGSDMPLLLGITLISSLIVFVGNFLADILYNLVDPRMRRRAV